MNSRLTLLEKMAADARADSFTWYALAMEYRKEARIADALRAFETLRERDPGYLPMYLMTGQMLNGASRRDEARVWLERGITLAREQGDGKALGELEEELEGG